MTIKHRPFNSPLESGLRSLYLLDEINLDDVDLQRLVFYDYLLVHSGDVTNGPVSLHPNIPHRSGEWVVRRNIVSQGLDMMFSRQLITKKFTENGICYSSSNLTKPFLNHLKSEYSKNLREYSKWVIDTFGNESEDELKRFMTSHIGEWGAEFKMESILTGENA